MYVMCVRIYAMYFAQKRQTRFDILFSKFGLKIQVRNLNQLLAVGNLIG
jgi:hypothetical protein